MSPFPLKGGIFMSKQDRQGVRTASDFERKYNFGKRFAEVMGIATDAQKKAEEASNSYEELDHDEVFNLLTKNGALQGLYRGDDGELYINASYLKSGKILADLIDGNSLKIAEGSTIAGWNIDDNSIFNKGDGLYKDGTFMSTGTKNSYSIGGSAEIKDWVFGAGGKWGVTKGGSMYGEDVHLRGEIEAAGGSIGGWHIGTVEIKQDTQTIYNDVALYSDEHYDDHTKTNISIALTPDKVYYYGKDSNGTPMAASVSWAKIISIANGG
jgi:hypothetical protein